MKFFVVFEGLYFRFLYLPEERCVYAAAVYLSLLIKFPMDICHKILVILPFYILTELTICFGETEILSLLFLGAN